MRHKGANLSWGLAVHVACLVTFFTPAPAVFAADNVWNNTGGGSWETPANWSLGVAPTNTDSMFLTNSGTYTVNIDNTTADTGDATTWLSVSNLTVGASSGTPTLLIDFTNAARTLWVSRATVIGAHQNGSMVMNTGTVVGLTMTVGTVAGSQGSLEIYGGTIRLTNNAAGTFTMGESAGSTGVVVISGGSILVTNTSSATSTTIGSAGYGSMTVSNGMLQTKRLVLGETATGAGTMSILQGGSVIMNGAGAAYFHLGRTGSGTIIVDGGLLQTTAGAAFEIARGANNASTGTLTVHDGTTTFGGSSMVIGGTDYGGTGAWNIHGGTNTVTSTTFAIANNSSASPSKGTLLMTGGLLDSTATDLRVGNAVSGSGGSARGTVIVSNGTWRARSILLGAGVNALGQMTIAGGTTTVSNVLTLASATGSTGAVLVTGGNLFVTNAAATATIDIGVVGRGSFTISNGTVVADRLFATNGASSVLTLAGGTLSVKSTTVSNGATFVAGNGIATTKLNLQGGTHSFADGLTLNTNATLSGDGFSLLTLGGNLALATNSTFIVDLMTNTLAGLDHAFVTGAVSIAGSALTLRITNYTHTLGEQFTLIDNDGTGDAVTGFFSGLTNNAFLDASAGGQDAFFRILYDGGDGNDVVLLATIPEPGVLALFAAAGLLFTLHRRR